MKINDTEILMARSSAIVNVGGGKTRLITKGMLIQADDPLVRGREGLFAPASAFVTAVPGSDDVVPARRGTKAKA
ncbi:MAG TPA: hypothetical protein VH063_18935 [Gaiellaceae bacterium]|nr:hypothetical protein [Gaiellaceae bacterium]